MTGISHSAISTGSNIQAVCIEFVYIHS